MSDSKSSYRNIIKSTSIFGGVQIYQIFISLIKSKFVALFLGVVGVGISGLLTSTLAIFTAVGELGLNYTATREIAQASHEKDIEKVSRLYTIYSRWLFFSSIISVIIVVVFAPVISTYSFRTRDYTLAFILLSVSLFFNIMNGRNTILLQGIRRLREIAKASIVGSTIGLVTSIPLYYFFGKGGIVPALIIASIASYLASYYFVWKEKLKKIALTVKQTISGGSEMVRFGLIMTIATLVGSIVSFLVNAYISRTGSLADVGLYNAGIGITGQYVGLVFTAMAVDYFPRLASISSDNTKVKEMVNQQSEITFLIILPLLAALILVAPLIIKILLTTEFIKLTNFIRIIAIGTVFQAAGYTISYIPLAKGDKKTYFTYNAILGNVVGLIFFTTGYYLKGLNGLAMANTLHQVVFFFIFVILTKRLYNYSVSKNFLFLLCVTSGVTILEYFIVAAYPNIAGYSVGTLILIFSIAFSIHHLNKLIDIKEVYYNFLNKLKGRKVKIEEDV